VGLIAFPGSAAATPPVVPSCAFPNTTGSDSCATLRVDKAGGGALTVGSAVNARLGVRVRSQFSPSTSETTSVDLSFDKRIALNLAGVTPTCAASKLLGKNIAQAWAACGPGGGATKNAYLSTGLGAQVSGIGSTTVDANGIACTMIFKGADNAHLSIYARAPIANVTTTGCNNPATNTGGSTTLVFTGTLSQISSTLYKWKLHVAGTQAANPALDDFYATVKRTTVFRAKCVSPMRMLALWDYYPPGNNVPAGDPNDTRLATDPCPP